MEIGTEAPKGRKRKNDGRESEGEVTTGVEARREKKLGDTKQLSS